MMCINDGSGLFALEQVMVTPHVAEALRVPLFCAFTMPWSRTRAFPNPFATTPASLGGTYNYLSYVMVEQAMWQPLRERVNVWRQRTLRLPPIGIGAGGHSQLRSRKVPFLYCWSPHLVPKPVDWPDWLCVTGNWQLREATAADKPPFVPPPQLKAFLEAEPTRPPVYIGFGSIVCRDAQHLTACVVGSLLCGAVAIVVNPHNTGGGSAQGGSAGCGELWVDHHKHRRIHERPSPVNRSHAT